MSFWQLIEAAIILALVGFAVAVKALIIKDSRRYLAALVAAWLIPGAGHVILGRPRKGLFLFGLLAITYGFGLWLSNGHTIAWDDNQFYFLGQFGSGLTILLGWLLGEPKAFPNPNLPVRWFDPGLLYVCVVGLLNVVIMIGVLDMKVRQDMDLAAKAAEAGAAEGSGEVKG